MKKIISMVLSFILILGCSTTAFAAETHNYDTENLPHDGADYFETEIKADEENEERISDFVTVYGYQYTKGSLKSGAWRNGTSGGSSTSSAKLSLNYTQDTSYNISFKASVSGGYTNGGTIGSELGVTLGASKSYSLGSGYSVTVPKGSHYLIKYRPMYYTYKVVETKYKEEKPFLIFDDPFVNLDDNNIKGSMKLLDETAKNYQVIYFTCSESIIHN